VRRFKPAGYRANTFLKSVFADASQSKRLRVPSAQFCELSSLNSSFKSASAPRAVKLVGLLLISIAALELSHFLTSAHTYFGVELF